MSGADDSDPLSGIDVFQQMSLELDPPSTPSAALDPSASGVMAGKHGGLARLWDSLQRENRESGYSFSNPPISEVLFAVEGLVQKVVCV
jgi:hypothetical protein